MRGLIPAGAMLIGAAAAQAATVAADHGHIVFNGKAITAGGQDSDPVLSPDGKRVAFTRNVGKPLNSCSSSGAETGNVALWVVNADGKAARQLLGIKPDNDMHKTVCGFQGVQFSSDGNLLYFETPAWATSGAIHVYDFRAGKEHFVVDGDDVQVLAKCAEPDFRDKLVVTQHKYFVFGGSYDWPWLISPAGKTLGLIGGDNVELNAVVKDACG